MGNVKRLCLLIAAICLLPLFGSCGGETDSAYAEEQLFAMDTYMLLRAGGENAAGGLAAAAEKINALEAELNVRDAAGTGGAARLNAADGQEVEIGAELFSLLQTAQAVSEQTGGAFDITTYPLTQLWGFGGEGTVPDEAAIAETLARVGYQKLRLDAERRTASLTDGAQIDLGAIAKGYAAESVREVFCEYGVESALINLGGNIFALGEKLDGNAWRIGIADPGDTRETVGVLAVRDTAVVTSGSYQRYFMRGAVRYHHLLDPATGRPADNGLESVTVVCADATRADALSTALFVMGEEEAVRFWRETGDFEMILIREDKQILLTPALADSFEITAGSAYRVKTVS